MSTWWAVGLAVVVIVLASVSFTRTFLAGQAGFGLLEPLAAEGPLHRLPARLKLLALVALVAAAALLPVERLWVPAALLGVAVVAARVPAGAFLSRLGQLAPFVLLASLGVLLHGDAQRLALVLGRAGLTVVALTLLAATTPLPALLRAGRGLGLPPALAAVLGLAVRYLSLLTAEASRLALAFAARAVGPRDLRLARPLGRLTGALAVRGLERGERVHQAMLARGYDGTLPVLQAEPAVGAVGWLGLALWVAALGAAVWVR